MQVYKAVLDGVVDVAVKCLKPEMANSASAAKRFDQEINVMRACRNSQIVGFIGYWAEGWVFMSALHMPNMPNMC